jgi:hypothetical protein
MKKDTTKEKKMRARKEKHMKEKSKRGRSSTLKG